MGRKRDQDGGTTALPGSLEEVVDDFVEDLRSGRSRSEATVRSYRSDVRGLLAHLVLDTDGPSTAADLHGALTLPALRG